MEFIAFGEGRIHPITPRSGTNAYDALQLYGNLSLQNSKKASLDFFLFDYRNNAPMLLNEEKQWRFTAAVT